MSCSKLSVFPSLLHSCPLGFLITVFLESLSRGVYHTIVLLRYILT